MKNQDKIKQRGLGASIRFYHVKEDDTYGGKTLGERGLKACTVCLIKGFSLDNKPAIFVRGLALCSQQDQFVKRQGKAIALGRAIQAIENELTVEAQVGSSVIAVSCYNATLTEFEKKLFKERPDVIHISIEEEITLEDEALTPEWVRTGRWA